MFFSDRVESMRGNNLAIATKMSGDASSSRSKQPIARDVLVPIEAASK